MIRGQTDGCGETLQKYFQQLKVTGTLWLESPHGSCLQLLREGESLQEEYFSDYDTSTSDQHFYFHPHQGLQSPELTSLGIEDPRLLCAALPKGHQKSWPSLEIDVHHLIARLHQRSFSGVVYLKNQDTIEGVIFFYLGIILHAVHNISDNETAQLSPITSLLRIPLNRATRTAHNAELRATRLEAQQALNACLDICSEAKPIQLSVQKLETVWLQSLLGLIYPIAKTNNNAGIDIQRGGFRYYRDNRSYLYIKGNTKLHRKGQYPALSVQDIETLEPLTVPHLSFNWQQRHQLTLRGQDALNPMTEVAMAFVHHYGRQGQELLQQLQQGHNLTDIIKQHDEPFHVWQELLERLVKDGFIKS